MPELLTLADFSGHVNTVFRVETSPDEAQDLELVEATPMPAFPLPPHIQPKRDPFSLIFRGPTGPMLPQKIHRLAHPALGALEIFLVPIGPQGVPDALHYQAVFN